MASQLDALMASCRTTPLLYMRCLTRKVWCRRAVRSAHLRKPVVARVPALLLDGTPVWRAAAAAEAPSPEALSPSAAPVRSDS